MTSHIEPDRPLRAYLDDLAELYDDFIGVMDQEGSPPRTWLQSHLPGGRRAVDIGCGNGRNCRMIADRYDEVVGVDISSVVIELAKNKDNPPNVRYEVAAIQDTSPEDLGLFDAVFSTNAVFSMGRISAGCPTSVRSSPRAAGSSSSTRPGPTTTATTRRRRATARTRSRSPTRSTRCPETWRARSPRSAS